MDPQDRPPDSDCIVHDHPVPPEEIRRYSAQRDPDAEQDIARYVELEASDEAVQHVERVKTEYVLGDPYEVWDVTTDKNRWWVITNLTNLYSQKHFPSLDYTISFHIGLMMRLRSRPRGADSSDPHPFDEVLRRQQQAVERHDRAVESNHPDHVVDGDQHGDDGQAREAHRQSLAVANSPQAEADQALIDVVSDRADE